jgi:hypothetical protein
VKEEEKEEKNKIRDDNDEGKETWTWLAKKPSKERKTNVLHSS